MAFRNIAFAAYPASPVDGQLWREDGVPKVYDATLNRWVTIDSDSYENIIRYGALCDGTTDNSAAIQLADTAATASGKVVYIPSCASGDNWVVDDTFAIANNVVFANNARIEVTAGNTVTFSKYLGAGKNQIFTGDGNVAFSVSQRLPTQWWGQTCNLASLTKLIADVGAQNVTLEVDNYCLISDNLTIPSNINVDVIGDGEFGIASTKVLTIDSTLTADVKTIFSASGNVSFGSKMNGGVYMDWFGAVCDSSTNNTTAINKAITSVGSGYAYVTCGQCEAGTYYNFNQQIVNANAVAIDCESTLNSLVFNQDAIVYGVTTDGTSYSSQHPSRINLRKNGVVYDEKYAGIRVNNMNELDLTANIDNFYIGLRLYSNNEDGMGYNKFNSTRFTNNLIGIKFETDGDGWINQNTFNMIEIDTTNSINYAEVARAIDVDIDGTEGCGSNVFINPSFQMNNQNVLGNVAIYSSNDSAELFTGNFFYGARLESNGTIWMLGGYGNIVKNRFEMSTLPDTVPEGFALAWINPINDASYTQLINNEFVFGRKRLNESDYTELLDVDKNYSVESASGTWATPNSIWYKIDDGTTTKVYGTNVTLQTDHIEIDNQIYMLAVRVDATREGRDIYRRIVAEVEADNDDGNLWYIPFDSGDVRLTGADYTPYRFVYDGTKLAYHYDVDTSYKNINQDTSVDISMHPDVAYAYIGVSADDTDPILVRNLRIYRPASSKIYINPDALDVFTNTPAATEIPEVPGAGNSYPAGLYVLNSAPSVGEPLGWRYTGAAWEEVFQIGNADTLLDASTGNEVAYTLNYTTNKSVSGNDTGLLINKTDTASPGTSYLLDLKVGGVTSVYVDDTGLLETTGNLEGGNVIGNNAILSNLHTATATDQTLQLQHRGFTAADNAVETVTGTITNSSGTFSGMVIKPTYNQTGTAAATDLYINRTETAVGSGAQNLINAQVAAADRFKVSNTGGVTATGFIKPASVVADPCGTYPIGATFYNSTNGYPCFCNNAGDDIQTSDAVSACFP